MIEKIEVGETYEEGGAKCLDINIFYKFGLKKTCRSAVHDIHDIADDAVKENRAS